MVIVQIREPPSKVPNIQNGDAVPLLNESNIYTLERLSTLWPGVSYIFNNYPHTNFLRIWEFKDLNTRSTKIMVYTIS